MTNEETGVIFYGSKSIDFKNLGFLVALFAIGAWMTLSSLHATYMHGLLGGILFILMACAGLFYLLNNQITNTPCITVDANGVNYRMNTKITYDAKWDSLDEFKALKNRGGRTLFLSANITGKNVSENLRSEPILKISFLSTLNVTPNQLLDDLNRTRLKALTKYPDLDQL